MTAPAATGTPPSSPAPDTKHPNLLAIERFFTAYAAKDVGAVREVLAPGIVWRIPGHHPLSGPKHGVDEVLAFFDQLAQADMKAQPYAQAVSDDYVLDFHRGWSEAGAGMDTTWCLAFRFEGGAHSGGDEPLRGPARCGRVLLVRVPPQTDPRAARRPCVTGATGSAGHRRTRSSSARLGRCAP
jgi:ketosteroid isomerase-like protein